MIVIAAVFILVFTQNGRSEEQIFKGAYIEYNVDGLAYTIPIDGTVRIEVTDITSDGYTVTTTPSGLSWMSPESKWYPFEDTDDSSYTDAALNITTHGTLLDQQRISTAIGTKEVNHYQLVDGDTTTDYYITTGTGLLVRETLTEDGATVTMEISRTNIDYYRNN